MTDDVSFDCELIREIMSLFMYLFIQEVKGRVEVMCLHVELQGMYCSVDSSLSVGGSFAQECLASCNYLTNLRGQLQELI